MRLARQLAVLTTTLASAAALAACGAARLRGNPDAGFQTAGYPGVFFLGRGTPLVVASTLS
jgi:hypothetical protein